MCTAKSNYFILIKPRSWDLIALCTLQPSYDFCDSKQWKRNSLKHFYKFVVSFCLFCSKYLTYLNTSTCVKKSHWVDKAALNCKENCHCTF
jgi:hypothetical protein